MRRLMFLISSEGKSKTQLKNEIMAAYRKYRKVEKKVLKKLKILDKTDIE